MFCRAPPSLKCGSAVTQPRCIKFGRESTHEMVQLRGWKGIQKALFFKMAFSPIQSKLRLVDIGHQQDLMPVGRRKPVLPCCWHSSGSNFRSEFFRRGVFVCPRHTSCLPKVAVCVGLPKDETCLPSECAISSNKTDQKTLPVSRKGGINGRPGCDCNAARSSWVLGPAVNCRLTPRNSTEQASLGLACL